MERGVVDVAADLSGDIPNAIPTKPAPECVLQNVDVVFGGSNDIASMCGSVIGNVTEKFYANRSVESSALAEHW